MHLSLQHARLTPIKPKFVLIHFIKEKPVGKINFNKKINIIIRISPLMQHQWTYSQCTSQCSYHFNSIFVIKNNS